MINIHNNNFSQSIKNFPIEEYLKSKDIKYKNRVNSRYYELEKCLNHDCGKQYKLIINKNEKYFRCFVCDLSGSIIDLISIIDRISKKDAIESVLKQIIYTNTSEILKPIEINNKIIEKNQEISLPLYFKKIDFKNICDGGRYLKNVRGYTQELIDLFDIRYFDFAKRVIFPIRDHFNKIVGWQARDITETNQIKIITKPEGLKKSIILYNYNVLNNEDMITIVEGPIDCHKAYQNNSVAIFGKQISDIQFNLITSNPKLKRINIGLDSDAQKEIYDLAKKFSLLYDVRVINMPKGKDLGDCSIDEANDYINCSEKFDRFKL